MGCHTQGRTPDSAEGGVAWTLLREEPPGGPAMDLPRSDYNTVIVAGEGGARFTQGVNPFDLKLSKVAENAPAALRLQTVVAAKEGVVNLAHAPQPASQVDGLGSGWAGYGPAAHRIVVTP